MPNAYLDAMTRVIFAHGGTIDKFIGDAVMVIFGAPDKMEVAEQGSRAISCALAMQCALEELNERWNGQNIGPLQIRTGIHHGPAVVGNFGSTQRLDYTAIGDTVNTASRIESSEKPGEILISPATADLRPENVVDDAGEFELKGFGHPLVLYRVREDAAELLGQRVARGAATAALSGAGKLQATMGESREPEPRVRAGQAQPQRLPTHGSAGPATALSVRACRSRDPGAAGPGCATWPRS